MRYGNQQPALGESTANSPLRHILRGRQNNEHICGHSAASELISARHACKTGPMRSARPLRLLKIEQGIHLRFEYAAGWVEGAHNPFEAKMLPRSSEE